MKQKTKDNLIHLGVAGAIVAAGTTYLFYVEGKTGSLPEISGPILWGIFSTPGIVALVLEQYWAFRGRIALWVILFVAGALNTLVVYVAYVVQWDPRAIVWGAISGLLATGTLIVAGRVLIPDRTK